jgi:hypothetical protein
MRQNQVAKPSPIPVVHVLATIIYLQLTETLNCSLFSIVPADKKKKTFCYHTGNIERFYDRTLKKVDKDVDKKLI